MRGTKGCDVTVTYISNDVGGSTEATEASRLLVLVQQTPIDFIERLCNKYKYSILNSARLTWSSMHVQKQCLLVSTKKIVDEHHLWYMYMQ